MGIFTGFEKGSGGTYSITEKGELVKTGECHRDPYGEFNGPVWFPKGGTKYFDKALNREFNSLAEKKDFMREHKLIQQASDKTGDINCPEAGIGKRMYFIPGVSKKPPYYKYR